MLQAPIPGCVCAPLAACLHPRKRWSGAGSPGVVWRAPLPVRRATWSVGHVRRPGMTRAIAAAAIAAAALAVWVTLSADFLAHPGWLAVQKADIILGPVFVGLYWLRRRPESRFGPLLVATGFIARAVHPPVLERSGAVRHRRAVGGTDLPLRARAHPHLPERSPRRDGGTRDLRPGRDHRRGEQRRSSCSRRNSRGTARSQTAGSRARPTGCASYRIRRSPST